MADSAHLLPDPYRTSPQGMAPSSAIPPVHGVGLGLRRKLLDELDTGVPDPIDFFELAPENWVAVGGRPGRRLRALTERHRFVAHGLSLNLGGTSPIDCAFVRDVRELMESHGLLAYSDHLSWCADDGHLYNLLPIPFTDDAVRHVAARIREVQDIIGERIAVENSSYYCAPGQTLAEVDFINGVLDEADCLLLLDVNNVYVNSVNHGYDAQGFLAALPSERIAWAHIAGHRNEREDLIVDTHGAPVIDPVWDLLAFAYETHGVFPTLLERDFNIPPLPELLEELGQIHRIQAQARGAAA